MIHVDEDDPIGELEPSFVQRDVVIKRGVNAEDFYELLTEIGRGKFGTVYHCREKTTGLELAAKFVSVSRREDRRNAEREVDIMRQLRHPRLIQLYDAFDTGKLLCVILELITGGELFERVIDDDFVLTEKACTVFMRQICEGIEFVHQQNILHLDMKPENILCLTKTGNRVKIIDFGLARKYDPSKKLQVLFGTPEFVAPEVVNFDQIGFGTDMWSIGVICYVLLSGLSPFMGETDVQTMANVTVAKYDFDDEAFHEISEDAKDFIRQLLVKDKMGRLTAQQCVAHKWLRKRPPPPPEPKTKLLELKQAFIEPPKNQHAEELDVAKDNLRLFVERWSEHPNSPYLFDVATHEITPCMSLNNCLDRSSSKQSLGGCSPSPCGSINSSPDSVIEFDDSYSHRNGGSHHDYDDNHKLSYSSGYHSLERRASDSSCLNNKKPDICMRVNLAEEIKKLSDHLYLLSTMNTDLVNNNVQGNTVNHETTSVTEKLPNGYLKTNTLKTNSSFSNGLCNSTASAESSVSVSNTSNGSNFMSTVKKEGNSFFNDTKSSSNISNRFTSSQLSEKILESNNSGCSTNLNGFISRCSSSSGLPNNKYPEDDDGGMFNNLPWARRKFKLTNSGRDVPLSPTEKKNSIFGVEFNKRRDRIDSFVNSNGHGENSNSRNNIPRPFYKKTNESGDVKANANNTKDLLLHLLDQWDESQSPPSDFHNGRHKSVSMEWSEAEKLASKSMSTLNTFFSRQSSTSSTVKKKKESFTANGQF